MIRLSDAWREWVDCDNAAEIMAAEAEVTKQVIEFLENRQWRMVRNNVGRIRRSYRFGEKGMADWLALSYDDGGMTCPSKFWLELKGPGEKPSADQEKWQAEEREKGATVIVADSLESFTSQYAEVYG